MTGTKDGRTDGRKLDTYLNTEKMCPKCVTIEKKLLAVKMKKNTNIKDEKMKNSKTIKTN